MSRKRLLSGCLAVWLGDALEERARLLSGGHNTDVITSLLQIVLYVYRHIFIFLYVVSLGRNTELCYRDKRTICLILELELGKD